MKKVITVKIPKELDRQLSKRIIDLGYGMRGKSKWLCEAIEKFLTYENFPELVDIASESQTHTKLISLRMGEKLLQDIERSAVEVRKQYPSLEGVKSNIIRASIYQRLINNDQDHGHRENV